MCRGHGFLSWLSRCMQRQQLHQHSHSRYVQIFWVDYIAVVPVRMPMCSFHAAAHFAIHSASSSLHAASSLQPVMHLSVWCMQAVAA